MTADPRRLLVISDTLVGGQGGAAVRHAEWFERRGWDVCVGAPADEPSGLTAPNHHHIPVPVTVRDVRGDLALARAIRDLRRQFRPDIVHCHGARSFAATRISGPAYLTLHLIPQVSSDPRGFAQVRHAGLRVVPRLAVHAFSAMPDAPEGWEFTPHASDHLVDLHRLGPPTGAAPTFLWLGRLDEPKRPDLFVDAMAALARTRPEARGLMAGSGPLAPAIEARIASTGAPVTMLGHRTDTAELIEEAWALVLFSYFEALTFSVQEAMWAGRAVVSSPLPGISWLVGDPAWLVDSVDDAAAAFDRLCDRATAEAAGEQRALRIRSLLRPDDPWPTVEKAYGAR